VVFCTFLLVLVLDVRKIQNENEIAVTVVIFFKDRGLRFFRCRDHLGR